MNLCDIRDLERAFGIIIACGDVGDAQELLKELQDKDSGAEEYLTRALRERSWRKVGEGVETGNIEIVPGQSSTPFVLTSFPLNLSYIGATFSEWLTARKILHFFLTGEEIHLERMFSIPPEILTCKDIIPVFRPAGATNRMAMDWKVKLGMRPSFEKTNVMRFTGAEGYKAPKLYYINKSVRPDENTLGEYIMSADDLIKRSNTRWLDLYGWSDADNLYSLITGKHFDSEGTYTQFPNDRFCVDGVAYSNWDSGSSKAYFRWIYRGSISPDLGARKVIELPLRTP